MSETTNNEEKPAGEENTKNLEDEGEDLPDNFFDDFQDQDFMDGLNVVDDWQDEEENADLPEGEKRNVNEKEQESETQEPDKQLLENKESEKYKGEKLERRENARENYSRRYSRGRRSRSKGRRSRSRNRYDYPPRRRERSYSKEGRHSRSPRISGRRDPEKTKRDIQRDKIRCAKDHEARVFQEQIKIAESGLCPPGEELDMVLRTERLKNEEVLKEEPKPVQNRPEPKPFDVRPGEPRLREPKLHEPRLHEPKVHEPRHHELRIHEPRPHELRHLEARPHEPKFHESRERRMERKEDLHYRKYSRSPTRSSRRSPHSSSRRRKSNLRTLSRDRSYSPKRRKRSSISRERDRERERKYRDRYREIPETDLRFRIREKRERQMLEGSPIRSKSPSYMISPGSEMSEREAWLRDREHRKRPSRSLSPVNPSRIRDSSPKEKKYTFLEEIEIKLRQTQTKPNTNQLNMVPVMPPLNPEFIQPQGPFQPPAPIPAPGMFPIPEQYQQPLMVGPDPNLMPSMMFPAPGPMFPHGMAPYPVPVPQPVPAPTMFMDQNNQNQQMLGAVTASQGVNQDNKEMAKLFEDKKISLSDFLSVSAKPLDTSAPLDIHNKIKVLSRCQEALKLIEDQKFIGRFVPRISQKLMEAEKRAAEKTKGNNQSPLRKGVTVRFNFTVPVNRRTHNKNIDQQSPKISVYKLMNLLGMPEVDLNSPNPDEFNNLFEEKKIEEVKSASRALSTPEVKRRVETFSASTQTKLIPCEKCEKRESIKYSDSSTQTVKEVCEIGTQVSVEDLTKSCTTFIPRGILKTTSSPVKSISHLTPAQLLAQMEASSESTSPQKQENYLPVRRPLLDHRMGSEKIPDPPKFNNSQTGNRPDHWYGGHMGGNQGGQGMGNMGWSGNYGSPMGGDRGPMGGGLKGDRGPMGGGQMGGGPMGGGPMGSGPMSGGPMGGNRALLSTPYQNRPGPNNMPNPNMSNYPGNNQGRPYHDSAPSPNLSIWGNQGMGRGMPNQNNMYYNNQRGPN